MQNSISLSDVLSYPTEYTLTQDQIDGLVSLLGYRCRTHTLRRLRSCLTYRTGVANYGIFERVMIAPRVQYVAGQDYPAEIRTVRNLIIGG